MVSVIIVAYGQPEMLKVCLESIKNQEGKVRFEVIVVDNSLSKEIESVVSSFPFARYFEPPKNLGYGAGNNYGAEQAKFKYLFFLNPDTALEPDALAKLSSFLDKYSQAGIAAPTLTDFQGRCYPEQGAQTLTPLTAVASGSIVHSIWPNNPLAVQYWQKGDDLSKNRLLKVVPGTALMLRKQVYEEVGGFDEQFFLYFEEHDLCRRVDERGWEIRQLPAAKVKHHWEGTTKGIDTSGMFRESRYKYFKKYYSLPVAVGTELFLRLSKWHLLILFLLIVIIISTYEF